MKRDNIVRDKSFTFACRVVKCCRFLMDIKKEYVLSKQLLRSGTAIGALVREAERAESKADFVHKLSTARKEANEADYWLSLLQRTNLISLKTQISLSNDLSGVLKLLTAIIKTIKNFTTKPLP